MSAHPGGQCAKCGCDVRGEELCGWCESDVLRVALADAQRERDEARADAARLREALELAVREMERASNVGEVRFKTNALASGVHIGLAEALFAARAAIASTTLGSALGVETRAKAERWLSDGPEVPGGTLAFHAAPTMTQAELFAAIRSSTGVPHPLDPSVKTGEPTPRDMRVAEALDLTGPLTSEALTRLSDVQGYIRHGTVEDLAAVVAKAVKL